MVRLSVPADFTFILRDQIGQSFIDGNFTKRRFPRAPVVQGRAPASDGVNRPDQNHRFGIGSICQRFEDVPRDPATAHPTCVRDNRSVQRGIGCRRVNLRRDALVQLVHALAARRRVKSPGNNALSRLNRPALPQILAGNKYALNAIYIVCPHARSTNHLPACWT